VEVNGQQEMSPRYHLTIRWMGPGPRAGLDVVTKRKNLFLLPEIEARSCSPLPSHYTDWATLVSKGKNGLMWRSRTVHCFPRGLRSLTLQTFTDKHAFIRFEGRNKRYAILVRSTSIWGWWDKFACQARKCSGGRGVLVIQGKGSGKREQDDPVVGQPLPSTALMQCITYSFQEPHELSCNTEQATHRWVSPRHVLNPFRLQVQPNSSV